MTEEQEITVNPFISTQEDFATAGLWEPAPYNFRFESMVPQEKEVKNGDRTGEKYQVITARLFAFEQALYNDEGGFEGTEEIDPERSRYQDFPIEGKGLARLKTAYKSVTGRMPQGVYNEETGRYDIDLLALAEELIGSTAWNRVFHTKEDEVTGMVYDRLTYTFSNKPPNKYYNHKPEVKKE